VELALALASGEILAMGKRSTPELLGLPLHLLTRTGKSIRTFGDENPIGDPRDISLYRRHISLALEGTVWVSPEFRYQVERWDMDGHLIETIVREAEWFPPRTPTVEEPLTRERPIPRTPKPMPPVFHGAYQDSEGLLWLNSVVTDPDWRKHFEEIKAENPRSLPWDGRFYNTMIEIIDPNTGKLLTSQRLPFFNWGFAGEKLIASRRTLESGLVVIDIWQLTLSR
jgi:hypothetical protein